MGAMSDTARGFAGMLAGSGIGVYRSDGTPYGAGETGIVFNDLPPAPDRCICLTAVPMTDATFAAMGLVLVQAKVRGLPGDVFDCTDLADAVFDLAHGATDLAWGSVHVIQIERRVSVPPTVDASRRWTRIDHFYIDLDFPPTAHRTDGGWD